MTDGWRPTNDVDALMYHALLRSDTDRFFRIVRESTLYVPAVTRPERRLVTWTRDGRSYLPVFTSPEAFGALVGTAADTVLRMTYDVLAASWPDPSWWLTINPTTPIEATLEIGDVATAAVPMPAPPVSASFDPDAADPANELEEAMAEVLAENNLPLLLDLLVFSDVLLPTPRPTTLGVDDPYFPWAELPLIETLPVGEPAIGVFTSEQRLAESSGGADVPYVVAPLARIALCWPEPEYALLVNPHSALRLRLPNTQVAAVPEWARLTALYHGVPIEA